LCISVLLYRLLYSDWALTRRSMHCRKSSAFSRGLPKYRGLPRYVSAMEILSMLVETTFFILTLESFLIKKGTDGTSFIRKI